MLGPLYHGSFTKTPQPPHQLHLTLLSPAFLGSSLSRLHPAPQTHVLHLATGPLHMTLPLPGSVLFVFPIILSSGKHSSPSQWGGEESKPLLYTLPGCILCSTPCCCYFTFIWLQFDELLSPQETDCKRCRTETASLCSRLICMAGASN